jgi:hypothetical protein
MIAERTALHSPKQTAVTGAWRAPIDLAHLTGIRAVAYHFTRSLTAWARVPVLPYAALWEASVVVSLLNPCESFESDRPAVDTSVLTYAGPRA